MEAGGLMWNLGNRSLIFSQYGMAAMRRSLTVHKTGCLQGQGHLQNAHFLPDKLMTSMITTDDHHTPYLFLLSFRAVSALSNKMMGYHLVFIHLE